MSTKNNNHNSERKTVRAFSTENFSLIQPEKHLESLQMQIKSFHVTSLELKLETTK